MEAVDAVVIGAGVVGLAVARALAREGFETVVIEREAAIGTQTSARNSEVIHAGLHHPAESLKARLCVRGRELLYDYLVSHGVAHRRCGKLLVATSEAQRGRLEEIAAQALRNRVVDLQPLTGAEARALEPALDVTGALWSPSTGIVDSHTLMLSLQGELEAAGGVVALCSPVLGIDAGIGTGTRSHVVSVGGDMPTKIASRIVINAAGLWAPGLAAGTRGLPAAQVPSVRHAKGHYFALAGRTPFSRLIYPVPEPGGLGIHLTLDLAGQARFGPDVEWLATSDPDQLDYRVDPARAPGFEAAIRRYWPGLPDGALQPAYAGVRPKLRHTDDFVLQGPADHGVAGLVNLYGIESPGLTASLALAEAVVSLVRRRDPRRRQPPYRDRAGAASGR